MTIKKVKCYDCGQSFDIDVEEVTSGGAVLRGAGIAPPREERHFYLVECPHCGAENKVELKGSIRPNQIVAEEEEIDTSA